jgi:hypothetical protein
MDHVSHLDFAPLTSPRQFSLPPIQLFWGGNEENQRIFYFHFLLLRREIQARCMRDLLSLTTGQWRSVLGNTYWKSCWPLRDDLSPDTTFDPNLFWKHGGTLFFGNTLSADVAAGLHDPSSLLPCHCDVQMTTADDPEIRQVILYYLNSYHVYEELKEMGRLQFKTTFEKRWRSQETAVNQIVEMWDPSGGGTDFKFFHNKKVWRNWLWAVREVVMNWDGFDSWDWGGFSVKTLSINSLSHPDFYRLAVRLLAFYIHSFVSCLGYYPSPLLYPPTFATPACSRCDHRRKFGVGYALFVM